MQIMRGAIDAAQSHHLGKRLRGDAHGFMPHQRFARHQQRFAVIARFAAATALISVPALQAFAIAHVLGQMLFVKRLNHAVIHQDVLAARLVLQVHDLRHEFFVRRHERQLGLPLRFNQCLLYEDCSRQHRIGFGKGHFASAVNHQPIQSGALERHDIAVLGFPVRIEQLFFKQMRPGLLQPHGVYVGNAAPEQTRGFHQFSADQPLARFFLQMHARVAVKLDAACTQVHVFFVLFAAYVAQQSGQHGLVQLLVAGGFVVHRPALFVHHGQELRMHVAPFAPTSYVDEVLPQQIFMLAVRQTRSLAVAAARSFQPIPQTQVTAEFAFFVLEFGVRLICLGLRL